MVLGSNKLTNLPTDMINTNTLVYMSGNPIHSVSFKAITNVDLAGTPYCDQSDLGCYSICGPGCSKMLLENYLCDLPCNTTECNYDYRAYLIH
ncbi:hypothetical protein THRCLA_22468 [Thraustotheca clavata]|uniref:Uncharacterized protein n=1 Tax=Thraustotheca clavata TaxID=74557 RepID=A0A1V9Z0D8_9STRA|nr:hypothetical protein THRCLA_22468 [Thraustotheca clavata]